MLKLERVPWRQIAEALPVRAEPPRHGANLNRQRLPNLMHVAVSAGRLPLNCGLSYFQRQYSNFQFSVSLRP